MTFNNFYNFIKMLLKDLAYGFYKNINNTKYDRNILLSYVTHPISKGLLKTHSNYLETIGLIEVFNTLGYNIDIANYDYNGEIDYSKYDIILGFGKPFGKAFWKSSGKKAIKICYMTGSLALFNQMERNKYLKERKGTTLIPRRNYYYDYLLESISMSDAIFVIGNKWTCSTIEPYNIKIFPIRLPVFLDRKEETLRKIEKKDFEQARKTFLWFGSSGAMHKGLDICLDTFVTLEPLNLLVCGPVDKEEDFFQLYYNELKHTRNIRYYGFVNIESETFSKIVDITAFCIFPTCSEGTSGSLLQCMSKGLIPIATRESGVNIEESKGILLDSYFIDYVKDIVFKAASMSLDEIRIRAIESISYTYENHNIASYKADLCSSMKKLGII